MIPCLNEEMTIAKVIKSIPQKIAGIKKTTVVVINDGSTDKTAQIAKKSGAIVVSHNKNKGVGAAFQTGITKALELKADIIVNMDGDGQFDPTDIKQLITPVLKDEADFVTASRFKDKNLVPKMPLIKRWGNGWIALLITFLIGEKFKDVSCGFRAYSQETALHLNLFGQFTYTQETFLDLAFKGLRILEVPIKVRGTREFGKSRVASNLWKYGMNSSKIIFRTYRDYKPMMFFGAISVFLFFVSIILATSFFWHYIKTGKFVGELWTGFSSAFIFMISFVFFITGLLADMFEKIRKNQERILYFEKKKIYKLHS